MKTIEELHDEGLMSNKLWHCLLYSGSRKILDLDIVCHPRLAKEAQEFIKQCTVKDVYDCLGKEGVLSIRNLGPNTYEEFERLIY